MPLQRVRSKQCVNIIARYFSMLDCEKMCFTLRNWACTHLISFGENLVGKFDWLCTVVRRYSGVLWVEDSSDFPFDERTSLRDKSLVLTQPFWPLPRAIDSTVRILQRNIFQLASIHLIFSQFIDLLLPNSVIKSAEIYGPASSPPPSQRQLYARLPEASASCRKNGTDTSRRPEPPRRGCAIHRT